jgi:ATP-binding cassette subfamily F protein uup
VLVLDEPTNDLDVETLELLEEVLVEWPGTLLLVSHDRAFLDNVATSTIVFEGDGRVQEYVGGYEDWLRQRNDGRGRQKTGATGARGGGKPRTAATAVTAASTKAVATAVSQGATKGAAKKRLSHKEQRELDTLPVQIESLEFEQQTLRARIADSDFYKEPRASIDTALARLDTLDRTLAEIYARWDELDVRR